MRQDLYKLIGREKGDPSEDVVICVEKILIASAACEMVEWILSLWRDIQGSSLVIKREKAVIAMEKIGDKLFKTTIEKFFMYRVQAENGRGHEGLRQRVRDLFEMEVISCDEANKYLEAIKKLEQKKGNLSTSSSDFISISKTKTIEYFIQLKKVLIQPFAAILEGVKKFERA